MRRTLALLAPLLAAALVACGSDGTTDAPPATTSPPASPTTASPTPQTLTASVGETLTLHAQGAEGSAVEVTVREVIDPYTLQGILQPEEGTRLVAFDLLVTNTGPSSYSDSPGNGSVLFDVDGVEWNHVATGEDTALVSVTLAPGDSDDGLVFFQIPEDLEIARLEITLSSGFGPDTGEWTL